MISRKLFLSFLLLFWVSHLLSQQAQMVCRNYNTDQGLPSSEVYDILQDREGYIWISTDNGVSRFDGYTFQNFGPEEGLENVVVLHLFEDTEGRIWMSTLSSKVYLYDGQEITPYPYNNILKQQKKSFEHFYVDANGTFYAYLGFKGLIAIQGDGIFKVYTSPLPIGQLIYPIENRGVITGLIHNQASVKRGLFASDIPSGDFMLSVYQSGSWKNISTFVEKFGKPKTRGALAHRLNHNRILASQRNNIFLLQGDSVLWNLPYPDSYNSFYESKEGILYFGMSAKKGLRVYRDLDALRLGQAQTYFEGLSISHIIEDKDGALWVASLEQGVYYISNKPSTDKAVNNAAPLQSQSDSRDSLYTPIQQYLVYNEISGLSDEYVSAICLKNDNEIFIGQENGDIAKLTIDPPKLERISSGSTGINDLAYDNIHNRLWAASDLYLRFWDGLKWDSIYQPVANNKKLYAIANQKLELYPEDGVLWGCSTGSQGFVQVDTKSAQILFLSRQLMPGFRTHTLMKDSSGRFWFGKNDGLFEFINKKDTIRPSVSHPAFRLRVEEIAQLEDSTLVIGTKAGGIVLWKGEQLKQLREADGMTSNMIEKIHIDAAQNIWVATLNGLNKVSRLGSGELEIETFTIAKGMPSNEINDISSFGNQVWVATTKGLVTFFAETSINVISKRPIIEKILVNQDTVDATMLSNLNQGQDNISFSVLSLNYRLNGKIPYRYRLHSGGHWTNTTNRNINFVAIAPGDYQFEVQAQNEDGFWSTTTTQPFTIHPPFWKTTWFITLAGLSLLSLIWASYRYRINHLQEEAAHEREVYELRQSALRAQMNPHFIFNCLNSIQGFIAEGVAQKATRHLAKFSRLVRLVLNASLGSTISLEEEIEMLHNYLQLEKMRFNDKFSYDIKVEDGVQTAAVQIPPLLTLPYVENAVIHGLTTSKSEGHVQITYAFKSNRLKVSIEDNGIGILASKQNKEGRTSLHKSVGMTITRKRLELVAGNNPGEEAVTIENITDANGLVAGTQVSFYVNLGIV